MRRTSPSRLPVITSSDAAAAIPQNPVVTSQEAFDSLYHAAAVMGKDGAPTAIDFSKQFVIGVVLPLTNDHTG
jgi:hypothetical protein